jgi:hypothetical protein
MRVSSCRCAILGLAFACTAVHLSGQQNPQASAAQSVQSLVKQHDAWGSRISTPGASLQAKEAGRDGAAIRYNLYASGLPTDRLYSIVSWPVTQGQPSTMLEGASLGKDGVVSCTGRQEGECNDPSNEDHGIVDLAFDPAKGEPFRLALVSGDQRAAVVIVPDPIVGKDKECTLNAVRLMAHFEVAYLTGSGYSPGTQASFESESLKEKHSITTSVDGKGDVRFALLPFVAGHTKGTMRIKGVGMGCSPSLQFDWGQ